jgi:hypothetical protein
MNKISKLIAALFAIVLAAQVHASVILQTSGSKLTGATGIEVGGKLYDVTFSGGSCADLFGGCDEISDFTFQTEADARAASQALLDNVFVDLIQQFDSLPNLTEGCSDLTECTVVTPFTIITLLIPILIDPILFDPILFDSYPNSPILRDPIGNPLPRFIVRPSPGGGTPIQNMNGAYALNSANESDDGVSVFNQGSLILKSPTYAIWVEQPTATVPEPSSVALIALGIVGLATVGRRKKISLTARA